LSEEYDEALRHWEKLVDQIVWKRTPVPGRGTNELSPKAQTNQTIYEIDIENQFRDKCREKRQSPSVRRWALTEADVTLGIAKIDEDVLPSIIADPEKWRTFLKNLEDDQFHLVAPLLETALNIYNQEDKKRY